MLILAGISVSVLFGEGGIIDKARLAGERTNAAVENEQRMLDDIADWMDAVNDKIPASLAEAASTRYQFKVTTKMQDTDNKTITIPKGFHVVGHAEDSTVKYGESNEPKVSDGIVIQDADGNQFVWVPVDDENPYKKHEYTETNTEDENKRVEDENGKGWYTYSYKKWKDWTDSGTNETSVKENKGFYIARYEAGVPENASFHVDASSDDKPYNIARDKIQDDGSNLKPVSKAKTQAWNYISQTNAKTVSENMYIGANVGVISSLVDGTAWDTVVTWIAKEEEYKDIVRDSSQYGNYVNNSKITVDNDTLWAAHLRPQVVGGSFCDWMPALNYQTGVFTSEGGNEHTLEEGDESKYKDVSTYLPQNGQYKFYEYKELATGASEKTRLKNIYDLAGNMYEWTTETGYHGITDERSHTEFAVLRGGGFFNWGHDYPVAIRNGTDSTENAHIDIGFRVVLYVK